MTVLVAEEVLLPLAACGWRSPLLWQFAVFLLHMHSTYITPSHGLAMLLWYSMGSWYMHHFQADYTHMNV